MVMVGAVDTEGVHLANGITVGFDATLWAVFSRRTSRMA